jgi:ABC-type histidine transport system ATPase subunit
MAEATPALEIRNLHKRYGELEVLKGISLTARDGDVISILGSSGSGKSTFLRCIVSLNQVLQFLEDDPQLKQHLPAVRAYREQFGV